MGRIKDTAKEVFGIQKLWSFQFNAVKSIMQNQHVFLVVPTGAGKSLTYQLPAVLKGGTTIVFSPLLSLMRDQVQKLEKLGIPAARLGSDIPQREVEKTLRRMSRYRILFVAPERLKGSDFRDRVDRLNPSLIAIDECHVEGTFIHTSYGRRLVEHMDLATPVVSLNFATGREEGVLPSKIEVRRCPKTDLVRLTFSNGQKQWVTKNHPYYVDGLGAVAASAMIPGDVVLVRSIDDGHLSRVSKGSGKEKSESRTEILQSRMSEEVASGEKGILLRPMQTKVQNFTIPTIYDPKTGEEKSLMLAQVLNALQAEPSGDGSPTNMSHLWKEIPDALCVSKDLFSIVWASSHGRIFIGTHEATQSNEIANYTAKSLLGYEDSWRSFWELWERREWQTMRSSSEISGFMDSVLRAGVCCSYKAFPQFRISNLLQAGLRPTQSETMDKGGWRLTQFPIGSTSRSEERAVFEKVRLESTESYEQAGEEPPGGDEDGSVKVYSITLERLHNYFADDVLVHNCHCVVNTSFRPAYALLREFMQHRLHTPSIALTATADPDVEEAVVKSMGWPTYRRIVASPIRENMEYEVINDLPAAQVADYLMHLQVRNPVMAEGSRIIYCATRKSVEALADILNRQGWKCGAYHAGLNRAQRHRVQDDFMEDKIQTITATNAFGMGVDKSSIRVILHFDMPDSVFSLIQEQGRAGRDGKPCMGILNRSAAGMRSRNWLILLGNPQYGRYIQLWDILREAAAVRRKVSTSARQLASMMGLKPYDTGQVEVILRVMEAHGALITSPGMSHYELPIRSMVAAQEAAGSRGGVKIEVDRARQILKVDVPPSTDDPVENLVISGAAYMADPNQELIIIRKADWLPIDQSHVNDKLAHDRAKLKSVIDFANASDKKSFVEQMFLREVKD